MKIKSGNYKLTLIKVFQQQFSIGILFYIIFGELFIKKNKIKIPVKSKGEPDLDFMEKYIKNFLFYKSLQSHWKL